MEPERTRTHRGPAVVGILPVLTLLFAGCVGVEPAGPPGGWFPPWVPDSCDSRSERGLSSNAPWMGPFDEDPDAVSEVLGRALGETFLPEEVQAGEFARYRAQGGRLSFKSDHGELQVNMDVWGRHVPKNGEAATAWLKHLLDEMRPDLGFVYRDGSTWSVTVGATAKDGRGHEMRVGFQHIPSFTERENPAWLTFRFTMAHAASDPGDLDAWAKEIVACKEQRATAGLLTSHPVSFGHLRYASHVENRMVQIPESGHHCGGKSYLVSFDARTGALATAFVWPCI